MGGVHGILPVLPPYVSTQEWVVSFNPARNINANDIVTPDFAPSVAEADAILAQLGYVDAKAALAVA